MLDGAGFPLARQSGADDLRQMAQCGNTERKDVVGGPREERGERKTKKMEEE